MGFDLTNAQVGAVFLAVLVASIFVGFIVALTWDDKPRPPRWPPKK